MKQIRPGKDCTIISVQNGFIVRGTNPDYDPGIRGNEHVFNTLEELTLHLDDFFMGEETLPSVTLPLGQKIEDPFIGGK